MRHALILVLLLASLSCGCMGLLMSYEHDKVVALGTPRRVVEWAKVQTNWEAGLAFPALIRMMKQRRHERAAIDAYVELVRWFESQHQQGGGALDLGEIESTLGAAYHGAAHVASHGRVPAAANLLEVIEPPEAEAKLHADWEQSRAKRDVELRREELR